jgi:7-cyano-7-deazaguanine synthase
MRKRAVIIMSGGPDSSTAAYYAKNEGYDVYGITFDYGQRASKETIHAEMIAGKLGIPIKVVGLPSLKDVFGKSAALCDEGIPMPSKFEPTIIVPFRNAIFLSIAVSYAVAVGAEAVFYGAQGSDASFYPDCREAFFKTFERAARLGTETDITIAAPFYNMTKSEVIKIGMKLGVPYELTWSCYLGESKHCGRCESCVNRKNAFTEAGVEDPADYAA